MKIKRNLPSFSGRCALIIVSGKQRGVLYKAADGYVERLDEVFVETPRYSDREGLFARRGRSGVYSTGAVYEAQDNKTTESFSIELSKRVAELARRHRATDVYLFAPRHLLEALKRRLKAGERKMVHHVFGGNYTEAHPFELLERIARRTEAREETAVTAEEAKIRRIPLSQSR